MPVNTEEPRPVDLCRFYNFIRDTYIEVAEDQRGYRQTIYDMHQYESWQCIVQLNLLHELNERNQNALVRNKHAEQNQRKDHFRAFEPPFGEYITVQRPKKSGQYRCRNDEQHTVPQMRSQSFKSLAVAGQVDSFGKRPHLIQCDRINGFKAGDKYDINRNQKQDGKHSEQRIYEKAGKSSLCHALIPFRLEMR